jgi:orotate phosphoribosyltransferase
VITTGGQVIKSAEELGSRGAIVDSIICVIWGGNPQDVSLEKAGIEKLSLFDMQELLAGIEKL